MAQTASQKEGKGHGKRASDIPMVVDVVPEEEAPETTGEDIADVGNLPELADCQVEGGPTREEFCKAQKECPTLEGLRQQASPQAAGKASGDHHLYWENDLLYSEPKVPQNGVGFSPFELLYGHPVRGPLSIVKEGRDKAPRHLLRMLALHNQTQHFWKQAKSNLEASQEVMKEQYDQKATLVEFSPGDKVWVMEPVEPRALQDRWTGPYKVKEQKVETTSLVDLKTPRNPLRFLHYNRLKPHFERSDISLLLVSDEGMEEESEPLLDLLSAKESDGSVEGVDRSDSQTPEQRGDCFDLLEQFSSLFSLTPGLTHLCVHDVDTGDSPP
ncbi:hypothetical protein NDU88_004114 [Pleurodeles waltl]|uniref:Uncharacterized protein n=1 Tax=Pleurodeles waltl TaxID=8319 RepID=A0AAV7M8A5_PLEWA|nr:hypothetical protein NDU88_004114 [Pleurodeles waltl]